MPKTDPGMNVGEQRIWLAALGKHPGWNDHLDDIGLDTERLVAVKRHLYVESVGGLINAGTWEAMGEEERDEGFSHSFFWRQPDGMVIGRMWSTSDGKGRRKYPMIVCAMTRGLPFAFVAGPLLERLRRLEARCREVSSAAEVIGAVDSARTEISELASHAPGLTGERIAGSGVIGSLGVLAQSESTGEGGIGLRRVLYQVEREMTAYIRPDGSATASKSRSVEVRGQHIRVPSPGGDIRPGDEQEAMGLWARALLTRVDPLAPMLLITKDGRPWVDIVVGELGPTPLSCLQGGASSHPYTSDIPFTIEGEVGDRIASAIEASRQGQSEETDPCFVDVPQERLAPFLRPRRTESKAQTDSKKSPLVIWIVIAATVVLLVIFAILAMRSGGSSGDGRQQAAAAGSEASGGGADRSREKPGSPGTDVSVSASSTRGTGPSVDERGDAVFADAGRDEQLDRFQAWCESFTGFYRPFIEQVDLAAVAQDPHLRGSLLDAIRQAEEAGGAIDPLAMTPGRFRSIETLVESPPAAVGEAGFASVIEHGQALIDAIRDAISPERWPTHASLVLLVEEAGSARCEVPVSLRSLLDGLVATDGAAGASSTAGLCALGELIRGAESVMTRVESVHREVSRNSPESVAAAYRALNIFPEQPTDGAEAWFRAILENGEQLESLGQTLASASATLLPRVDRGLLTKRLAGQPVEGVPGLEAWLSAVQDRSLYLLDPATDPRQGIVNADGIAEMRSSLNSLVAERESSETRELEGLLGTIDESSRLIRTLAWNEATRQQIEEESEAIRRLSAAVTERIDAEQRKRALQAEAYIAELNSTDSVSETGSPVIDLAWREARDEAIERFKRDADVVSLSRTVDGLRDRLRQLEERMPDFPMDRAVWGAASASVSAEILTERENRLREAIESRSTASSGDSYKQWFEGVEQAGRSLAAVRTAVESWAWDEQAAQSSRDWVASWVGSRVDLRETEPLLARHIGVLTDESGEVCAEVCRESDPAPATLLAAWIRLDPGRGDPRAGIDSLGVDAEIVERIRARLDDAPPDRRDEIEGALATAATVRWRSVARGASQQDFLRLVVLADALRIPDESLSVSERFDLFVADLRNAVASGGDLDRAALLETVNALIGSGVEERGGDWLARFADELAAREGREVDYRVIGPGRAGWAVQPFDGGRVLVYSWAGGEERRQLAFRLIESPEVGVVYIGDTEAPAWLLTEYAVACTVRDAVLSTLPEDWDPLPDTRPGPHAWTWGRQRSGRAIRLARTWVDRNDSADRPYYPEGSEDRVGRPEPESPLQRVSDEAALAIAASVGCRLPSEGEWQAAYRSIGSPAPSDAFNLRDAAFDRQRAHTVSLGSGLAVVWPDRQSFAEGLEGLGAGAEAESHAWTDGTLWFLSVGSGPDRPLRHLVGNVGEFVLGGLGDPSLLGDRGGDVENVTRSIAGRSVELGVIGASALSPPSLEPDRAVVPPADTQRMGYTDAGFRLAFSPGVEAPLVILIDELLDDAPFLRGD